MTVFMFETFIDGCLCKWKLSIFTPSALAASLVSQKRNLHISYSEIDEGKWKEYICEIRRLITHVFVSCRLITQEYPAIYSVKYLFFSNFYLRGHSTIYSGKCLFLQQLFLACNFFRTEQRFLFRNDYFTLGLCL